MRAVVTNRLRPRLIAVVALATIGSIAIPVVVAVPTTTLVLGAIFAVVLGMTAFTLDIAIGSVASAVYLATALSRKKPVVTRP
jgi:hypothetical protein